MKNNIVVCDFDGTVSTKDSLYYFFKEHAPNDWLKIEAMWRNGEISSKECLLKEFELIPNLNQKLIDNYTKTIKLDKYFKDFINFIKDKDFDFIIVSDGLDYFINRILENNGICGLDIITNHAEFIGNSFRICFPNDNSECKKDSGTCKCEVIKNLRKKYKTIIYVGDGVSDWCVADKADILFAKSSLLEHCKKHNITYNEYDTFDEVMNYDIFKQQFNFR